MPGTAQDRVRRGPLAALLILLSLVLAAGTAAAGSSSIESAAARLGTSRHGTATALLPPGTRNTLDDEAPGLDTGPSIPPSAPGIVTEILWAGPRGGTSSGARPAAPRPAGASYRARAPPAS